MSSKNSASSGNNFVELIFCLVYYYFFSTYTSDISYYDSFECVSLLYYCQIYTKFLYFSIYFKGIRCICGLFGFDIGGLISLVYFITSAIEYVFFFIIGYALFKGEPCGALNILVKIWIGLSCVVMSCCCCCTCCAGILMGLGKISEQSNHRS